MQKSRPLSPANFIKHAADVSSFYGFRPIREVERQVVRVDRTRGSHSFTTVSTLCAQCVVQKPTDPVLAFYATGFPTHLPGTLAARKTGEFGLHVAGLPESLGEVLLLKTLFAIINEWGGAVARVRVNALGDHDSKLRFERELAVYLRKNALHLEDSCRDHVANPLGTYTCASETCRQILSEGPRAMNFLSERSRGHFREVLEHIERLGLPYELDDLLVGDERAPCTVFALDLAQQDGTIASVVGGRFDDYTRKQSGKKEGAAVHASIFFQKAGAGRSSFIVASPTRTPKVYFVQLGNRAKLQGLAVVDMLRHAQVPVSQSFDAKSLAPQLQDARERGVSTLLIMGQREALDGTLIVRSTQNSSQQIIQVAALPRFLKHLKV